MRPVVQLFEITRQTLALLVRSRMTWLFAALALVFAALVAFLASRADGRRTGIELFAIPGYWVVLQFALPFTVLYLAVAAVHGDIEDRTVVYLFARPISRPLLLAGKWLAASLVGIALASLALVALYFGLALPAWPWYLGRGPRPEWLQTYAVGAALAAPAYAAIGACIGAFAKRPLVVAIAYVLGWEVLASNLPPEAGVRVLTVADPLRRFLLVELEPTGTVHRALATSFRDIDPLLLGDPLTALARLLVLPLGLAIFWYARREYDLRGSE